MPTYLYEHKITGLHFDCPKGKEFEIEQKITEDKLTNCPECKLPVNRLISGSVGINWKGGAPTPKTYV